MIKKLIKNLLLTTGFATALLIVTLASPLSATTLTIKQHYTGGKLPINLNYNGNTMQSNAGENTVYFEFDSYTGDIAPAYCVDLDYAMYREDSGKNKVLDIVAPTSYSANGIYVEWLMDTYGGAPTKSNNAAAGTGLQLAIWEVLYDFDDSFSGLHLDINNTQSGSFWYKKDSAVTDNTNAWYNYYITGLVDEFAQGSNYTSSGDYIIAKLAKESDATDYTQDMITLNPVPEPTTMLLFGLGLLGLGAVGRRKI